MGGPTVEVSRELLDEDAAMRALQSLGPDQEYLRLALQARQSEPGRKTWEDVLMASRNCPVLHWMVHAVERRGMAREDALIAAVMWFSEDRRRWLDAEVERLRGMVKSSLFT